MVEEALSPPKTGDWAKILVVLDPGLGGTGVTTGDETEANPEGAPIIYLNPNYIEQVDFFRSLAVHEFGHAIQFQYRDWYGASESEPWFWEATSEWMTEVVNPDWNQYAWSSRWYADAPGMPFDSMVDFHQYGMMLLNAYIDQYRGGAQTIWSIWVDNEGHEWIEEIERAVREPAIQIWGEFVGAYAAGTLVDSEYYETPLTSPKSGEISGELGSAYVELEEVTGVVEIRDGLGTMVRDGAWFAFENEARIPQGESSVVVVVTNPNPEPMQYAVVVRELDTGAHPSDTTDEEAQSTANGEGLDGQPAPTNGCSCAARTESYPPFMSIVLGILVGFRYRFLRKQDANDCDSVQDDGSQKRHVAE